MESLFDDLIGDVVQCLPLKDRVASFSLVNRRMNLLAFSSPLPSAAMVRRGSPLHNMHLNIQSMADSEPLKTEEGLEAFRKETELFKQTSSFGKINFLTTRSLTLPETYLCVLYEYSKIFKNIESLKVEGLAKKGPGNGFDRFCLDALLLFPRLTHLDLEMKALELPVKIPFSNLKTFNYEAYYYSLETERQSPFMLELQKGFEEAKRLEIFSTTCDLPSAPLPSLKILRKEFFRVKDIQTVNEARWPLIEQLTLRADFDIDLNSLNLNRFSATLKRLSINGSNIGRHLVSNLSLEDLEVSREAEFEKFDSTCLRSLGIGSSLITRQGFESIVQAKNLTKLSLSGTYELQDAVETLKDILPNITDLTLRLSSVNRELLATNAAEIALFKSLNPSKLVNLKFSRFNVDDQVGVELQRFTRLETLHIITLAFYSPSFIESFTALSNLKELQVDFSIDDEETKLRVASGLHRQRLAELQKSLPNANITVYIPE